MEGGLRDKLGVLVVDPRREYKEGSAEGKDRETQVSAHIGSKRGVKGTWRRGKLVEIKEIWRDRAGDHTGNVQLVSNCF